MGSHGNPFISFGVASFSPDDISDLKLWLDASDAATITKDGGNLVSQWDDKSGEGNDVSQGTPSQQPLWVDAVQNGLPIIRFDAVNDFLNRATYVGGALAQPNTIFVVCKFPPNSSGTVGPVFDGGGDNNERHLFYNQQPTTSTNGHVIFAGAALINTTLVKDETNIRLYDMVYNGGSSQLFRSSSLVIQGNAGTDPMDGISLAVFNSLTSFFSDPDIGEIIIYNKLLTTQEKDDVRDFLNTKWGL